MKVFTASAARDFLLKKYLVDGKCPIHKTKPEYVKEESYFFRLSNYQKQLLDFYKKNPDFISPRKKQAEIINRVKEGLKDLSITRTSFKWGIPFPLEKGHVVYVWFDALPNYITALGWPKGENFKKYWPADVHHIGVDILWFHSVIWPAVLLSAGIALPKKVFVHGWLTINGQKISKSIGNVIDPVFLAEKYGADTVRYFLLREVPYGEDGDFSEAALVARNNSDLADTLGNLLSRSLTLIEKFAGGVVPKPGRQTSVDLDLQRAFEKAIRHSDEKMEKLEIHHALDEIWAFIKAANKYVDEQKPWTIKEKARLDTVLYNLAAALRVISGLIWPFTPGTAEEIAQQLQIKVPTLEDLKFTDLKAGTKIKKGKILFKKFEFKKDEQPKIQTEGMQSKAKALAAPSSKAAMEKPMVKFDEWQKLDLRVGKIEKVEDIEGSDKLYKITVNLGAEKKTTAAGLKQNYKKEQLKGKKIIFLANLEPVTLRGVKSEGMILAAVKGKSVAVLEPEKDIEIGARIE